MDETSGQKDLATGMPEEGAPYSYDVVPYESHAFASSHPTTLASVATLFGLKPAQVVSCRVLELGCAAGWNIIPVAASFPKSQFVGVELSKRQVADGTKAIKELGLRNIEIRCQSIDSIGPDLGKFDYIIAHGVYSWVPEAIREKIVQVSKDNLAENGIAYISYNTYPGWHMPQALREMILYHTAAFKDAKARVAQARALLQFLSESTAKSNTAYSQFLKSEVESLRNKKDYYIFHEYLEMENHPVYFHQLAANAKAKGLQYLGDSAVSTMLPENFSEKVAATVRSATSIVKQEQYMDFLRNRRFRSSLFCHASQKVNHKVHPDRITPFLVRGLGVRKPAADGSKDSTKVALALPGGSTVTITMSPPLAAAMELVWESGPKGVPFKTLAAKAKAAAKSSPSPSRKPVEGQLAEALIRFHFSQAIGLSLYAPPIVTEPGPKPKVAPLTRFQARGSDVVTNHWHAEVRLGVFERKLVEFLDGTNGKSALADSMEQFLVKLRTAAKARGRTPSASPPTRAQVEAEVDASLRRLARAALLIS